MTANTSYMMRRAWAHGDHDSSTRLQDIPLFYPMLASGSQQHAQERTWLLRLLAAGLRVSSTPATPSCKHFSSMSG
jgi:hypothetical protein